MAGVVKSLTTLLAEVDSVLADLQAPGAITEARMRQLMEDFAVTASAASWSSGTTLYLTTSYDNDTQAAAGGVPLGGQYRNGNFIMVRVT